MTLWRQDVDDIAKRPQEDAPAEEVLYKRGRNEDKYPASGASSFNGRGPCRYAGRLQRGDAPRTWAGERRALFQSRPSDRKTGSLSKILSEAFAAAQAIGFAV